MIEQLRHHGWRYALVLSGILLLVGGSIHPDSDAEDSLRQELTTMTSHDAWVPSHAIILASTVLLATGLILAYRRGIWPEQARGALAIASIAVSLYVIEASFHLAAAVDTHRLRDGDFAPIAFTHIALAAVLFPITGIAIAYLAAKPFPTWSRPQQIWAVAGMVGGLVHAVSVPAVLIFADTEVSALFVIAATGIAVWSFSAGLVGMRAWADPASPQPAHASSN